MLTGELTEGVGSVHLSMFACSLVQRRQAGAGGGGGGGGGGRCLYRVISDSPTSPGCSRHCSGRVISIYLGGGSEGEINKKKANSRDRAIF